MKKFVAMYAEVGEFICKEERNNTMKNTTMKNEAMSKDDDKVIEAMVKYVLTGRWNKKVLGEKPVR